MNCSNANAAAPEPEKRPKLEFPDWNGMKPHRASMSPSEAFDWNEKMLALFPQTPAQHRRKMENRPALPEFVL